MKKIGFIGLGVMGKPMVMNLIKAGHQVTVFDQVRSLVDELKKEGAHPASSLLEAVGENEIVITMLPNSPHVKDVCLLSEQALIQYVEPGTIVIDMSSISPEVTKEINEAFGEKGVSYIDAPVSGGYVGAVAGSLSIMVGGEEQAFEQVKDVLACMGKRITYMGPSGAGQTTKLCNQIMVTGTTLTMSEALALGKKSGLDLYKLRDVLVSGGANCWHLEHKAPLMIEGNFEPSFKSALLLKDINLAIEKAKAEQLELPVLFQSKELYEQLINQEGGNIDYIAIIKQIYKEF
ncbi:NAD(P)-dependent oxidoreductase [Ammoniphilus resinae]|uniref:2-hydroxy-3-oxopropionate reductase n=1 Tax=Ammoniphilus resinae TaxID=861532 RepID=A0ABS4GWD4_9BACL|nr:NAD(P)-dependent oxidoreductase [Ammoniphilus resinae]MBP1934577.1 2-hydroxy-3-oxopropionate reductase [Ammoniphilus resinae]